MIYNFFLNITFFLIILTLASVLVMPDTKKRILIVIKFLMWAFFFLLLLRDDFLTVILLIIYVGAIAIMFLLASMVINLDENDTKNPNGFFLLSAVLITLLVTLNPTPIYRRISEYSDNILQEPIVYSSNYLFNYAILLTTTCSAEFLLCGAILTLGAIGLISLCIPSKTLFTGLENRNKWF